MLLPTLLAQAQPGTGVVIDFTQQASTQGLFTGSLEGSFGNYISAILRAIMVIAALSVLIFLVWAGMDWITSGGEKSKIEAARNKITGAVIGIIVLASTLAIFGLVTKFLDIPELGTDYTTTDVPNTGQPGSGQPF